MALAGAPSRDRPILCWLLLLLAACSTPSHSPQRLTPTQAELRESRERWLARTPAHYRYVLRRVCECLPEATQPVLVSVRSGMVESLTYADSGSPVPAELVPYYYSVDGLFRIIQEASDRRAADVRVDYHATLGYPVRINIDYDSGLADEEAYYTAWDLERLP